MTVVSNNKQQVSTEAVYIGHGSVWGNPFVLGVDGSQEDVCNKYEALLAARIDSEGHAFYHQLAALKDKHLVCNCTPLCCHKDTLSRAADWAYQELIDHPT